MLPWALRKPAAPLPGFGRLLGSVLAARGVEDPERLLNPSECGLPPAAGEAAAVLKRARRVFVAADYDCDGLCGAAILLRALRMIGVPALVHVPRRDEGYGLSPRAVEAAVSSGCDVLCCVDLGVTSRDEVAYAASKGLKVVVLDHHRFEQPPPCLLVHPRGHENPALCGAGVAYKVARAMGLPEHPFAQLAAVATLADAAEMTEGNRALVRRGLSQPLLPGLRALLDPGERLTPEAVVFRVAPRINAAGRVKHPLVALRLLMAEDERAAGEAAAELNLLNLKRRELVEEALRGLPIEPVAVVDCPPGVLGVVAARICEALGLPAAAVDLRGRGSARAPEGYDLVEVLSRCPSVRRSGGHARAAGFEVDPERISSFREEFPRAVVPRPSFLTADALLSFLPEPEEVAELGRIGPFGPGNPEPLFLVRGRAQVRAFERLSRLRVGPLDCVLFGADASRFDGEKVAAVGTLRVSSFTGRPELVVRALRPDVHLSRAFLARAWARFKSAGSLPDSPECRLALRVFRELGLNEEAGERKNLFESRTYRRYALEVV